MVVNDHRPSRLLYGSPEFRASISSLDMCPIWWERHKKASVLRVSNIVGYQQSRDLALTYMQAINPTALPEGPSYEYAFNKFFNRYVGATQGYGKGMAFKRKAHTVRQVKLVLRATAPAATAEQSWAGYTLKVRQRTKEERDQLREWRWLFGYWGANAQHLPGDDKVWSNWVQVHTQPLHARKSLYGI